MARLVDFVDRSNDLEEVTCIHQILLGGDGIIVEGLTNLNALASEAGLGPKGRKSVVPFVRAG